MENLLDKLTRWLQCHVLSHHKHYMFSLFHFLIVLLPRIRQQASPMAAAPTLPKNEKPNAKAKLERPKPKKKSQASKKTQKKPKALKTDYNNKYSRAYHRAKRAGKSAEEVGFSGGTTTNEHMPVSFKK